MSDIDSDYDDYNKTRQDFKINSNITLIRNPQKTKNKNNNNNLTQVRRQAIELKEQNSIYASDCSLIIKFLYQQFNFLKKEDLINYNILISRLSETTFREYNNLPISTKSKTQLLNNIFNGLEEKSTGEQILENVRSYVGNRRKLGEKLIFENNDSNSTQDNQSNINNKGICMTRVQKYIQFVNKNVEGVIRKYENLKCQNDELKTLIRSYKCDLNMKKHKEININVERGVFINMLKRNIDNLNNIEQLNMLKSEEKSIQVCLNENKVKQNEIIIEICDNYKNQSYNNKQELTISEIIRERKQISIWECDNLELLNYIINYVRNVSELSLKVIQNLQKIIYERLYTLTEDSLKKHTHYWSGRLIKTYFNHLGMTELTIGIMATN